jgi:hypothetical protein
VSVANLSLIGIAEDLLSLMWPALMGLCGVEIVAVRRVLSATKPPRLSLLMAGAVTAIGCCAAITAGVLGGLNSLPPIEAEFSYASFLWSDFAITMWPVLAVFALSQVMLLLLSDSRSSGFVLGASLVSAFTVSWNAAWWLYVGPQVESILWFLSPRLWVLGVAASGLGFVISTTTLLIGRRIAFARRRA